MAGEITDARRTEPAFISDERTMLERWLEFHRMTLQFKCEGLTDEERKRQPVPTSILSLHGILRHMAEVEGGWFGRCLLRNPDQPYLWFHDDVEDSEITPLDDADWASDLATFQAQCDKSREAASTRTLDDTGTMRDGTEVSLRWIYVHMIEEYARHNGHADIIRELVDGEVGW